MHPNATFVRRNGEVDAWDNADFRAAVQATGKQQVILAGFTTDVCTSFLSLALALADAGYTVFANIDASGTFDAKTAQDANDRMRAARAAVGGRAGAVYVRRRARAHARGRLAQHPRGA